MSYCRFAQIERAVVVGRLTSASSWPDKRGTLIVASGGLSFLLLRFLYLITMAIINYVLSMNLFRFQQLAGYQCRSLVAIRYAARAARYLVGFVVIINLVRFK